MALVCEPGPLSGLLIIRPEVYRDARGLFMETYRAERYREGGIHCAFIQDNLSRSRAGALRGLHYQLHRPQAKLVMVTRGSVFDVAVDIRRGSPTFGQWFGIELSEENATQLFVPGGFAHGFHVLSEEADFVYKCSDVYDPSDDRGILWSDPDLAIRWPSATPTLSAKDARLPLLHDLSIGDLPVYSAPGSI